MSLPLRVALVGVLVVAAYDSCILNQVSHTACVVDCPLSIARVLDAWVLPMPRWGAVV
jgi:hypothetical protein